MPEAPYASIEPGPTGPGERVGEAPPSSAITLKRILWPVLLSIVVLGIIGYLTYEPGAFQNIPARLHLGLFAAAIATVVLRVFFGGWRLSYISKGKLGFMDGTRGQLAWDFFSNVTPSAIGGGPIAAVYIARERKITVGEATAFMLFTMLLDQIWFAISIPVVVVTSFYIDVIPRSLGTVGLWGFTLYFVGMLLWVVLFAYATVFRPELLQRLADRIFRLKALRRFQDRVGREMNQLGRRARVLRSQPLRFYLNGFLLTLGTWISRYLLLLFILWSVYTDFDKVLFLLRSAAMTLGSLIMPTPGGAGGVEGLYALFLGPLMPKALLAPTLLTWRILGYYLFIALGVFLTTQHVQRSIRQKRQGHSTAPPSPDAPPPPEEETPQVVDSTRP